MALATPEFLQTKSYSALRDRLVFAHGGTVQEGAWGAGDFKVTQRGAGANMSADVAAGFALIAADDPGNNGLYHLENDATVNVPQPTAAHATLPRIDSLYVQVNDSTHGTDATDTPVLQWATGTATAGTTLDSRAGAAVIPTGAMLLADALVPAASTSITTANIRDRRTWARGAFVRQIGSPDANTTSTSIVAMNDATLSTRLEVSGTSLIRVRLHAIGLNSVDGGEVLTAPGVDGAYSLSSAGGHKSAVGGYWGPAGFEAYFSLGAGSHIFNVGFKAGGPGGTATIFGSVTTPQVFTIEEMLKPSSPNS